MPDGPNKGTVFPESLLIPRYYEVRGWDRETGFPLAEILRDLGLEKIAEDLEPYRADYRKLVEKAANSA